MKLKTNLDLFVSLEWYEIGIPWIKKIVEHRDSLGRSDMTAKHVIGG